VVQITVCFKTIADLGLVLGFNFSLTIKRAALLIFTIPGMGSSSTPHPPVHSRQEYRLVKEEYNQYTTTSQII
jgi:hypothetical protein